MKLSYNITTHLTADEIKEIVIAHIARTANAHVENVQFDVTKDTCGLGASKYECLIFKGMTVRIGDKIEGATVRSHTPDTSWVHEVDRQGGSFTDEEIERSKGSWL